jgi:hypothetical protein
MKTFKRNKRSEYERFMSLTDAERDAEVSVFDDPSYQPPALPKSEVDRRLDARVRGRGRPKVGQGARRVLVTVEGGLLKRVDAWAKRHGMSRSELVSSACRRVVEGIGSGRGK